MKKICKEVRVYYPNIYRQIYLFVLPILIILGGIYLTNIFEDKSINLILAMYVGTMIYILGDYFVFNGICTRDAAHGILKCSLYGKKVLGDVVLFDLIYRLFVNLVIYGVLGGYTSYTVYGRLTGIVFGYLALGIATYLFSTLLLNGFRYVTVFMGYALFSGTITEGFIVILMWLVMYPLLENTKLALITFIVLAVLAVAVIYGTWKHMMYRYQLSFGRKVEENE